MEKDTYQTITSESEGLYKEKGSKFISFAFPVKTEEEIKEKLEAVKKKFYDARHHCYAYRLGEYQDVYRHNDDGEPSGTAGKPIFGQIQSFDLTFILVVVVRYFGGTKLGASGLITAYKEATKDALQTCDVIEKTIDDEYMVYFEYPFMNQVMRILKEEEIENFEQDFQIDCKIKFKIRKGNSERVFERFKKIHQITIKKIEDEELNQRE